MRCTYPDGTKISYSGPFQIMKGKDINVFIKDGLIPSDIKAELDAALIGNSCTFLRVVGDKVTKVYGTKACVHE